MTVFLSFYNVALHLSKQIDVVVLTLFHQPVLLLAAEIHYGLLPKWFFGYKGTANRETPKLKPKNVRPGLDDPKNLSS